MREKILSKLAQAYKRCSSQLFLVVNSWIKSFLFRENFVEGNGNGIIIFDEVQKVLPGGLDFFSQLFDGDYFFEHNGARYNVANTIVILITDIGADDVVKFSVVNSDQNVHGQQLRRNIVASVMNELWYRLRIGKFINEIVPFFPLSQIGLEEIMDSKLHEDRVFYIQKRLMSDLIVESEVVSLLCSASFVHYDNYTVSSDDVISLKRLTKIGHYSKRFASHGARSLLSAGPLFDLRQLIHGHIGHLRDDYLHIGIFCGNESNEFSRSGKTCNSIQETNIFIAWCFPTMVGNELRSIRMSQGSVVSNYEDYLPNLSSGCNIVWTGSL